MIQPTDEAIDQLINALNDLLPVEGPWIPTLPESREVVRLWLERLPRDVHDPRNYHPRP